MHKSRRVASAVAALVLLSGQAFAQSRIRGTARVGADFGGDKVLQFKYSDGSTPDVVAGAGLSASIGGAAEIYKFGARALDAQLNLGVKYRTIPPAANQTASWVRFPVEGLLMYGASPALRVGGGATMHLGNVMEASGAAANAKVTFKAQPGFIAQTEWMLRRWSLDLRYTAMKYAVESGGSGDVNANSFGAGVSYWFGPGAPKGK